MNHAHEGHNMRKIPQIFMCVCTRERSQKVFAAASIKFKNLYIFYTLSIKQHIEIELQTEFNQQVNSNILKLNFKLSCVCDIYTLSWIDPLNYN